MLGRGGLRDRDRARQLAYSVGPAAKPPEDRSPGWVRQRC